jgi:arsenite-transporting ATPase
VRLLLYSGKGGVGKTSLSAATAVRAARQGQRTLVVSTDAAHSLADALGSDVGPEPVPVARNLHALEIDVGRELSEHWGVIHEWLTRFMSFSGVEDAVAEEMAILPGMEELFSLLRVKRLAERGHWELIVVDCAPTGETVRMLGIPEVLEFYFTRIFPIQRSVVRSVRPVARRLTEMPIPDDAVFGAVQALYGELEGVGDLLRDPKRSSIRLVLNPERMVVRESQRLYTYLCLFGFPVDAVIANRVLPAAASSPFFDRWLEIQAGHLAEARVAFEPLPFLEGPLFDREMVGLDALDEMGRAVFGRRDPAAILHRGRPLQVKRQGDGYALELALPFARKERLQVWSTGEDLVVVVDNQRRHVPLPRSVAARPLLSAALNDGVLRVVFGGKEKATHGR